MDVQAKLDEIEAMVRAARAMPMSASCVLHRGELLAALEELRELVPQEVSAARAVLRDRSDVVDDGRREADRLIEGARAERARLVSKSEVVAAARVEAEELLQAAREEALALRADADDYVDSKLANFEVVLTKTLRAVERGRAKLREQDLRRRGEEPDEEALLPG